MKLLPALAAAAQVGAAMVATRFMIDQTGPASLAMLRYAVAWLLGESLSGPILLAVACVAAGLWLAHRFG